MDSPAARALVDYLNEQVEEIAAGDAGLRAGEDPIHDTRVATRRLRSTLRVFGKLLDSEVIGDLDGELKWYAALLGDVRDCQVQLRRFGEVLDTMPDELVLGPVRSRIRNELKEIELPARALLGEAMESERYRALLARLRSLSTTPPWGRRAAAGRLRKRARRARRKADRRLIAALRDGDDAMLHRARKAAKRARYAAELCEPMDKQRYKPIIKHYKKIQTVLGDHQDAVVASAALRRMAVAAGTTVGENGFTYGLLYSREQQIAEQSRRDAANLL